MHANAVGRARMLSQGIVTSASKAADTSPCEVVTRLGALQAQDYAGVLWSIGLRAAGSSEAEVEAAFERREIVRTWPMRGTLHVIPAADARWMLGLLTPRVFASTATRRANLDLDDDLLESAVDLCTAALEGGRRLTRAAMMELFERGGIATDGQRGYHILFNLSMRRHIVFGPREGKEQTFVLFDEWLPDAQELPADEALRRLTRTYFRSHGPATARDFAGWTGLTMTDVRRGLDAASSELVSLDLGGTEHWMSPETAQILGDVGVAHEVRLLPGFDEFVLGYKDRSAILDGTHSGRIVPGGNGVFRPTVLIDGRIAGTWKRVVKRNTTVVEATPFTRFTAAEKRSIETAAEQYLEFLNGGTAGDRRGTNGPPVGD